MVNMAINPENIKRLEDLGYEIPRYYNQENKKMTYKRGTTILISVENLLPGSPCLIDIACDYCGKEKTLKYKDYYNSLNSNEFVKKYCCKNCDGIKKKEINKIKFDKGLLVKSSKGYWTIQENRIKEILEYVEKYKYLDHIDNNHDGKFLAGNIRIYEKDGIRGLAIKAGLDLNVVYRQTNTRKTGRTLDEIIKITQSYIDKYEMFPTQHAFKKELGIPTSQLNAYGGSEKIKELMEYKDINDLVDDSGFKNRSTYEYFTAQFLIHNNIKYLREQLPFPQEGNFRSDFTFILNGDKRIECEIWGYLENDITVRGISYKKNKEKKIKLYEKYNIELISIPYEVFQQPYLLIQKNLISIFKKYLDNDFKQIDIEKTIPIYNMTNEELFNSIMKYSEDGITLPRTEILKVENYHLLYEVNKRFIHYSEFARNFADRCKYDVLTTGRKKDNSFWDLDKIFEVFDKSITIYGKILSRNEIIKFNVDDLELKRINNGVMKFGGLIKSRFIYYNYLIENNKKLPIAEIDYLKEVAQIKQSHIYKVSEDAKTEAYNILKQLKEVS